MSKPRDYDAVVKESRWWDTFNATLGGFCARGVSAVKAEIQDAHTMAVEVHGFTPESYKGER